MSKNFIDFFLNILKLFFFKCVILKRCSSTVKFYLLVLWHNSNCSSCYISSSRISWLKRHKIYCTVFSQPTEVNLNHMICPAVLDPFEGQYYRTFAVFHQAFLCPALCKLFCCICTFFLTSFKPTKIRDTLCFEAIKTVANDTAKDVTNFHEHTD